MKELNLCQLPMVSGGQENVDLPSGWEEFNQCTTFQNIQSFPSSLASFTLGAYWGVNKMISGGLGITGHSIGLVGACALYPIEYMTGKWNID